MARGRNPGCDGLPMEFYLRFWPVLGADLVLVLNSAFTSGLMSPSQRCGIITLSFNNNLILKQRIQQKSRCSLQSKIIKSIYVCVCKKIYIYIYTLIKYNQSFIKMFEQECLELRFKGVQ